MKRYGTGVCLKLEASKKERINMDTVKRATGCDITARQLEKGKKEYDVRDYGAGPDEPPVANKIGRAHV